MARIEDTDSAFEIWRRLHEQFSLPERLRAKNFSNEIIGFTPSNHHLESDLSGFMILKNRGRPHWTMIF